MIRADSTASHVALVPASRLRISLEVALWVAEVYEQGQDGLWRCRWPARRALEHLPGASPRRWMIAVRLLRGDAIATVWGAHGVPPDPTLEALRPLRLLERWTIEEAETEWIRRPRQWWDPPRKPNARAVSKSDAQANAEHETPASRPEARLQSVEPTGTVSPEIEAPGGPRPISGPGSRREVPSGKPGARQLSAIPTPHDHPERACA